MHGFLHAVPAFGTVLDPLHVTVRDHLGGAVLVRVYHFHEVLVRRHEGTFQIHDQIPHGLVSPVRAFLTAFKYDLLHTVGNFRNIVPWRRHLLLNMFDGNGHRGFPVKRHPSGQHFKHCNAQRVDIALFVGIAASGLLRGCVMDTSHDIGGNGIAGSRLCNTEIRHLYFPFLGNNDVLRFNVPVYDVVVVGRFYTHAHLNGNAHCLFYRESCFLFNILL